MFKKTSSDELFLLGGVLVCGSTSCLRGTNPCATCNQLVVFFRVFIVFGGRTACISTSLRDKHMPVNCSSSVPSSARLGTYEGAKTCVSQSGDEKRQGKEQKTHKHLVGPLAIESSIAVEDAVLESRPLSRSCFAFVSMVLDTIAPQLRG